MQFWRSKWENLYLVFYEEVSMYNTYKTEK